jgi:hypothetical protein
LLGGPVSGFARSERLATLGKGFNEAEMGSRFRITADVVASPGFDGTVARDAAGSLHGERAIPMASSFPLTRSARLGLAHVE